MKFVVFLLNFSCDGGFLCVFVVIVIVYELFTGTSGSILYFEGSTYLFSNI